MEPERLIIEAIRDKLRAAYKELRDTTIDAAWKYRDQPVDEVAIRTAQMSVDNWENALTVALDRLIL